MNTILKTDYMLFSNANTLLGKVCITQIDGESCHGEFFPTTDFAAVENLFAALIEYANDQIFPLVDEVEKQIGALGLFLQRTLTSTEKIPIFHAQIGQNSISFRLA